MFQPVLKSRLERLKESVDAKEDLELELKRDLTIAYDELERERLDRHLRWQRGPLPDEHTGAVWSHSTRCGLAFACHRLRRRRVVIADSVLPCGLLARYLARPGQI